MKKRIKEAIKKWLGISTLELRADRQYKMLEGLDKAEKLHCARASEQNKEIGQLKALIDVGVDVHHLPDTEVGL